MRFLPGMGATMRTLRARREREIVGEAGDLGHLGAGRGRDLVRRDRGPGQDVLDLALHAVVGQRLDELRRVREELARGRWRALGSTFSATSMSTFGSWKADAAGCGVSSGARLLLLERGRGVDDGGRRPCADACALRRRVDRRPGSARGRALGRRGTPRRGARPRARRSGVARRGSGAGSASSGRRSGRASDGRPSESGARQRLRPCGLRAALRRERLASSASASTMPSSRSRGRAATMASSRGDVVDARLAPRAARSARARARARAPAPRLAHGAVLAPAAQRGRARRHPREQAREGDEREGRAPDEDEPQAGEADEERAGGREERARELPEELPDEPPGGMPPERRPPRATHLHERRGHDRDEQVARDAPRRGGALLAAHQRDPEQEQLQRQRPGDHAHQRREPAGEDLPDRPDPVRAAGNEAERQAPGRRRASRRRGRPPRGRP